MFILTIIEHKTDKPPRQIHAVRKRTIDQLIRGYVDDFVRQGVAFIYSPDETKRITTEHQTFYVDERRTNG